MGVLSDIYWYGRIVKEEMGVWRERLDAFRGLRLLKGESTSFLLPYYHKQDKAVF